MTFILGLQCKVKESKRIYWIFVFVKWGVERGKDFLKSIIWSWRRGCRLCDIKQFVSICIDLYKMRFNCQRSYTIAIVQISILCYEFYGFIKKVVMNIYHCIRCDRPRKQCLPKSIWLPQIICDCILLMLWI